MPPRLACFIRVLVIEMVCPNSFPEAPNIQLSSTNDSRMPYPWSHTSSCEHMSSSNKDKPIYSTILMVFYRFLKDLTSSTRSLLRNPVNITAVSLFLFIFFDGDLLLSSSALASKLKNQSSAFFRNHTSRIFHIDHLGTRLAVSVQT